MKIKASDIPFIFEKFSYACFIMSGQDPVQLEENKNIYSDYLKTSHGFTKTQTYSIDKNFDWSSLLDSLKQVDFFSEKTIYILKSNSANFSENQQKYLLNLLSFIHLNHASIIFIFEKVEKATEKKAWFQKLLEQSYYLTIWPLEGATLINWLKQELQKHQLSISSEGLNFLMEQMEHNTLALQQTIKKLALFYAPGTKIELKDLMFHIQEHSVYNVFDWMDILLKGQAEKILQVLTTLREESSEPTLILWALAKLLRTLIELQTFNNQNIPEAFWKKNAIWSKKQALYLHTSQRFSKKHLFALLRQLWRLDEIIKSEGTSFRLWDGLAKVALQFKKKPHEAT